MAKVSKGILLGYGSIGKHHARILDERYEQVAIIDLNQETRAKAAEDYPAATVVPDISTLEQLGWAWEDSIGVIATWGPNHESAFMDLVNCGVTNVLCEKPFAHSVRAGANMIDAATKHGVSLGVHHHTRYSGFVSSLNRMANEYGLGEPYSVVMHGGALGLVTNGIHYIDLASELFGKSPESVISTAHGDPLNPRSKDLKFYGGTACWSFGRGQELVMSFSNMSSVTLSSSIYYRNAVVHMARNFDVEVRCRDKTEIEKFPSVTRAGPASDVVFSGKLPGVLPLDDRTKKVLDEIESGQVKTFPPSSALEALGACIGALTSGVDKCSVNLPIDPNSNAGKRDWAIS